MSEKLQQQCSCDTHRVFQVIIQRFILQDSIAKELYKPAVAIDMGMCFPCFKSSSTDLVTPDVEIRRRHQIEAAERRMREQETRGIKEPERFKLQQLKKEELDRRQQEAERKHAGERGGGGLRWQVD